jgi:hypothetical protein
MTKQRDDFQPCPPPALADSRVSLTPETGPEGDQRLLGGSGIDGMIMAFKAIPSTLRSFQCENVRNSNPTSNTIYLADYTAKTGASQRVPEDVCCDSSKTPERVSESDT